MPGEWEPHAATWIGWPHNRSDWPGKFASIPWVYAEIVRNLARAEQVNILVNHENCGSHRSPSVCSHGRSTAKEFAGTRLT